MEERSPIRSGAGRFIGIDVGAETIKVVELTRDHHGALGRGRGEAVEHHKNPTAVLLALLEGWDWDGVDGAAVVGRFGRLLELPRVPTKQARASGFRYLFGDRPATLVSIGGHGFSVLELRDSGVEVLRENSRCSQGTGNFLKQLVARFDLSIEEASALCEDVEQPAPLSGRCPVILKTDMTHLANKGESQARILAGLYDAVCENVQVLIKPSSSPRDMLLLGGVGCSRRIRHHFERFATRHRMRMLPVDEQDSLLVEALGCARLAADNPAAVPRLGALLAPPEKVIFDLVPAPRDHLPLVKRMQQDVAAAPADEGNLILGFDIGSTGSKVVALEARTAAVVWEGYISTNGNPVRAARALMQRFVDGPAGHRPVVALGATGSGREIVGSLLSTCYGPEAVFVLNEIAAHAEGALHHDPRVDTIFEIGGQDAKYIRLAQGRVVDAAMNEACSAGTGSFIEEQGRKFDGIEDVIQLGQEALEADGGVSLGQHCSVFMAEIIDGAVAAGIGNRAIIAGIYDSIIQNYLNRVKGARSVGQVIFCQGMPFSATALAAAVARQTGSEVIIPPNPGTVGALGIALLTRKAIDVLERPALDPQRFLAAKVVSKDVFVCKATRGCGGAGNRCRIDRIATLVDGQRQRFTWGGGCSLWDRGTGKRKLPDRAPDPFREREDLVRQVIERTSERRGDGRRLVALTDEFILKSLFPFFATYIHELGFDLLVETGADQGALKRGIEEGNVPFCAPMQQFHGLVSRLAQRDPDVLFLPMIRNTPWVADEAHAATCPIAQASPDMLRWDLDATARKKIVSPVIDLGPGNLHDDRFVDSCRRLAAELGVADNRACKDAYQKALATQNHFDARCLQLGRRALEFCAEHEILPVVVLGRPYTIYNTVLNSNVPAILREQGAVAVPVDCYPVEPYVPLFRDIYWGYGQLNLRAAHQIRRTRGIYSLWCSNYSCGPDSFTLHFYSYLMAGKPFAVIETDGHSGDAGTKTRVEAFLHCVREDLHSASAELLSRQRKSQQQRPAAAPPRSTPGERRRGRLNALKLIELDKATLPDIRRRGERVLVPRMGIGAETLAACLRGVGVPAEALPLPDRESVRIGRRHTSGKECVPMCITLGSLLQRLERARTDERFAFFMPTACGPCRFGVYNVLHKIVLERLAWRDRVRVWSPVDSDYFAGVPSGFAALIFTGFMAIDVLLEALHDVRPVEREPGAASELFERHHAALLEQLEQAARGDMSVPAALMQLFNGRLFGVTDRLRRAAADFAAIKGDRPRPTVMMVGEIYVRLDPFANDFVIDKLESHGIRVRLAPFDEWLEYTDRTSRALGRKTGFGAQLSSFVQRRIQSRVYSLMGDPLGWPARTAVSDTIAAAAPYVREALTGEAVLTVGGPLHEHHQGLIDGVVNVGPLECMPLKIAEAQLFHIAEHHGLPSLTIPLNGDPIDAEVIDSFAFEIHAAFRERQQAAHQPSTAASRRAGLR